MLSKVGLTADYEITAEPTAWGDASKDWGMNLSVANSGHCLIEVTVEGIKSHIWRPDISVNAIMEAAKLLPKLKEMAFTHVPSKFMGHTPPCCSVAVAFPAKCSFRPMPAPSRSRSWASCPA
jgi:acetylornithine deacetylase